MNKTAIVLRMTIPLNIFEYIYTVLTIIKIACMFGLKVCVLHSITQIIINIQDLSEDFRLKKKTADKNVWECQAFNAFQMFSSEVQMFFMIWVCLSVPHCILSFPSITLEFFEHNKCR